MIIEARWQSAAGLVAGARDVIDGRAEAEAVPEAVVSRGWHDFLAALTEQELGAIEAQGTDAPWPAHTPVSLREMLDAARGVCAVPSLESSGEPFRPQRRRETPRKGAQVDAFARLVLPLAAHADRVVDVGAGHGHLTRQLAERLPLPVVGLERDRAHVGQAQALPSEASPVFVLTDVLQDGLPVARGDCIVGLHACGELGDAMVEAAARCGAAVALVGCCLQKRRQDARRPLCPVPVYGDALDLPARVLGLSNLTPRAQGVEASLVDNLAARERRLALRRVLAQHGFETPPGAEMDGLNRRNAQRDLGLLVAQAFARQGAPPPRPSEVDDAARWAHVEHGRMRRWGLPRTMLARALEVFVLLDRARYLEARGHAVTVGTVFAAELSPRNLALVARGRPAGP